MAFRKSSKFFKSVSFVVFKILDRKRVSLQKFRNSRIMKSADYKNAIICKKEYSEKRPQSEEPLDNHLRHLCNYNLVLNFLRELFFLQLWHLFFLLNSTLKTIRIYYPTLNRNRKQLFPKIWNKNPCNRAIALIYSFYG